MKKREGREREREGEREHLRQIEQFDLEATLGKAFRRERGM